MTPKTLQVSIVSLLILAILVACAKVQPTSTPEPTATPIPSATTTPTITPTATATRLSLFAIMNELAGDVQMRQASQDGFSPAALGDILQVEGQVKTGDQSNARLDLSTGTIIRVAPNTMLTLQHNEPAPDGLLTRFQLLVGQMFILLNGGSLDVETPSGLATVRGSYMIVEVAPETQDTVIACLEGSCQAQNTAGSVDLIAGQKALLSNKITSIGPQIKLLTQEEIQAWLDEHPEIDGLLPIISATMTAMPPLPTVNPTIQALFPTLTSGDSLLPNPGDPLLPRPDEPILPRPDDPILPRPDDPIFPRPGD
jgi:hypothetical protein